MMNKEDQIEQLIFFTKWLKENGLNPSLWTLIEENEKMLIELKIDKMVRDSSFNLTN